MTIKTNIKPYSNVIPYSPNSILNHAQCPSCQTTPSKQNMQRLMKEYKPRMLEYERIVRRMNKLTKKAKARKIAWWKYSTKWKRLNRQFNLENPNEIIGGKLYPKRVIESILEFCQKCNMGSGFHIEIFSDLEPQPMLPKYAKIQKTTCPKCGMLGTSTRDQRGYVRFMHYRNGKRKVCYIGKVANEK